MLRDLMFGAFVLCLWRQDPPVYMGGEKLNSPETEFIQRAVTVGSAAAIVSALRDDVP
jgi:hypothetical protein